MPDSFTNVINPNVPGLDTALSAGQRVTTRASTFLFSASQGAIIASLLDPYGSGSTFATVGVVPAQLALSGSNIVKGAGVAVPGTEYRMKVLATSSDGQRETSAILSFTAKSEVPPVVVTPTPSPTPTPTPTPSPTIAFANTTASVTEGDSGTKTVSNVINVTRNGVTGPLTVNLTYGGTATSGTDYAAGPVSGTIADGLSSLSFDLTINGDTGVESDETIVINAVLAAYSSATASKTITVTNDDVTVTPTPTGLWRSASPSNRMANSGNGQLSGGRTAYVEKYPHWIGTADRSALRVNAYHFAALSNNTVQLGGTLAKTVGPMYLIDDITGTAVAVNWGGQSTIQITPGDVDINSDVVLPSAFGLTVFPVGRKFWLTAQTIVPTGSGSPFIHGINAPEAYAVAFSPASTTITNLNTKDAFTYTGAAPVQYRCSGFILLGTFVSGDPATFGAIGDSIIDGIGERASASTNPAQLIHGWFERSLWDADGVSNPKAGINFGISGSSNSLWRDNYDTYFKPYMKYNRAYDYELGTNNFGNSAANPSALLGIDRTIYAKIKVDAAIAGGGPVTIARTKLLAWTVGPWVNPDGSDQTAVRASWEAGGVVDTYNNLTQADVGTSGGADRYLNFDSVVRVNPNDPATVEYHRWKAPNYVADGIHPLATATIAMAALARTYRAGVQ